MERRWATCSDLKLTLFLRVPRAPLDNNIVERALKKSILHRKNSLFYKNRNGAQMGDLFRSQTHAVSPGAESAAGQQHRGAGIEEIDPASQELAVLQEPEWSADGRPVHELDSHLRTQPRQSVRLPHRVAASCWGVAANAVGLDALELPRDAGADRRPLGCGIGYAESWLAEKDGLWPCRRSVAKWPPNGHLRRQNLRRFLARYGNQPKCSEPASTPACPPTINRSSRCRSAPCGNTPSGGVGPSPCK